jgi:hypothetical protein
MKGDFPHASEAVRKLNPHIFGPAAGLRADVPQQAGRAAQGQAVGESRGEGSVEPRRRLPVKPRPCLLVCIVAFRRSLLDDDNAIYACKHLRDAIADSLTSYRLPAGQADGWMRWEYHQALTRGPERTVVLISTP